jgi:hypothetical protein
MRRALLSFPQFPDAKILRDEEKQLAEEVLICELVSAAPDSRTQRTRFLPQSRPHRENLQVIER